jgi:hypothetical protein
MQEIVPQSELDEMRKLDCSVTNIIPKTSMESLKMDKPLLVIVGSESVEALQNELPGKWTLIEKGRRNHLYYREAD